MRPATALHIVCGVAVACVLAACPEPEAPPEILRGVKKWAGRDASVLQWREVAVPGAQAFLVNRASDDALEHCVLVVGGRMPPIEGDEALRTARDRVTDPTMLAKLALAILSGRARVITDPGEGLGGIPPAQAALARAPRFDGDVLEYWWVAGGLTRALVRDRVNIVSGLRRSATAEELLAAGR